VSQQAEDPGSWWYNSRPKASKLKTQEKPKFLFESNNRKNTDVPISRQ
jgi:hypothetical protein